MPFEPFALEEYQSRWERTVAINLADSSVQCATLGEWLSPTEIERLGDLGLFYPEVNGTGVLRERIAALYPGAGPAEVLVTVGAAEANTLACQALLSPGDEVVVVTPGYGQVRGLARIAGCSVHELALDPADGWRLDLDALDAMVTSRTRLVGIVNPNNPTGTILSEPDMDRIVTACARVGAWLHADEVYRGTERDGRPETPTFWGRYDRLICTNSLSKAYGLAGLRIGWAVASRDAIEALWRRHEYVAIAAAAPSMALAELAVEEERRARLLSRQRALAARGFAVLDAWLAEQSGRFSLTAPAATAIAFVRCHLPVDSVTFAHRVREQAGVLVAPGALLGAEGHLRVTVGYPPEKVARALAAIAEVAAG
ncbi:MAG: aminotransferase class I/II-fold pyridoxal phosphate-dependent enzyme [Vicinamibacterales bacterium]